jgi:hypothetical protein
MTITDSHPSDLIRIKLDFIRPFPSTSTAEFTFKPEGSQTAVTWSTAGPKHFMSKAVGLFMTMDKMLGGDFGRGLANLKSVTEMPVLLLDQDRARWDHVLVRRGLAALERAQELGGALGPYALQAAIAACHARARTPAETDWARIAALYDALAQLAPSPVVELNRAVALAMAFGPAAGLQLVDALTSEPSLKGYHLLPAVRGDLLAKLGRFDEARAEFERAASLTRNARERELLLKRAATCARGSAPPQPR